MTCHDCATTLRRTASGARCPACGLEYDLVPRPRTVPAATPDPVPPPVPAEVPVRECQLREVAEHRAVLAEIGATDPAERWRLLRVRMGARWSAEAAAGAVFARDARMEVGA